jgi:hypothetical protein
MKKLIVPVVLLVLAALLSIPFAGGLLMERSVRNTFDNFNRFYADNGLNYTFEIVNYDRHYLTSDIEWKIDLGAFKSLYHIDEINFKDHAEHGFNGVVSTTSLEKNPWYADFVAKKLNGKDPIHISTQYGLLGGAESTFKLDPFVLSTEGEKIDIKEGRMVVAADRKFKNFTTSGDWRGLRVGEKIIFGKTSMASKLKRFSPYIWDGDIDFEVAHIKIQDQKEPIELKELTGKYLLKVNSDQTTTSWDTQLSIGGINTPKMFVDNSLIHFAINGINIEGYEAFMKLYIQNISHILGDMPALDKNSKAAEEVLKRQMATMGFQLMGAYEKLLKKGLEIKVSDLNVKLADGEINGDMTLRLLKDMTFMQFTPIISQPEQLFDIFYLKSNLSLPVTLVGENPKMLTPVYPGMQTGLFVKKGANLLHQAETVDGKFILNNEAVLLPGQNSL